MCKLFTFLISVCLKQDTLRLVPLATIFEWELALVKDGQLVRNNNVGIFFVIFMLCIFLLVHTVLENL